MGARKLLSITRMADFHFNSNPCSLNTWRKAHNTIAGYVKTTGDDLRAHFVERERSDAYQWLLLVTAHDQRHILQIHEVKSDPKFPGK